MGVFLYVWRQTPQFTLPVTDRRSDDRIRELCSKILGTKDQDELVTLCVQLRKEIQNHVKHLRGRISEYPYAPEKRKRPTESDQES